MAVQAADRERGGLCYKIVGTPWYGPPEVQPRGAVGTRAHGETVTNDFTLTETSTEATALAFADVEGCARWLRGLPLSNIPKHYEAIRDQLKRLSDAEFSPRERARIAEVFREPVLYLHTELARRYAGKPQPATEKELEASEHAIALWQGLWNQYSACLKPLLEGDPELQGVKAKVIQRGLWVGKQLVLVYGLARRLPIPAVWQELHAYYRLAEILECTVTAVSDELMPNAIGVSCYSTYSHALLLQLAAELQLGHDCSVEACTALLTHLDSRWYAPPKKTGDETQTGLDLCVGGLGAAYFRVAGRTFNRQDPLGRLSYHGTQHLATLGALTDYDRNKEEAEKSWAWEHWQGTYDSDEAMVRRVGGAQHRWHLEQLVILRDDERVRCGYVTRVALDGHGDLSVTMKLWAGAPTAIAVRPMTTMLSEDPPIPGILIGPTPDEKATIITPPRTFNAGRVLRSIDSGPERRLRLTRLLRRGADFERVAFDETPS